MKALRRRFETHATILINAGSLVGTRVVTYGLGFIYWWLAAHTFEQEAVGLASAAVSAMMLIGSIGVLGLNTLLIGELPRRPQDGGSLITTALLVSGLASTLLGALFALLSPYLSGDLAVLAESAENLVYFTVGVLLTTVTLVLDQALIGLLHGEVQLWRNLIFSCVKVGALLLAGFVLTDSRGLVIYGAWTIGNLVSLGYVLLTRIDGKSALLASRPQWRFLRELKGSAFKHYGLNLTLQVPGFTLPLLVTVFLSTETTAKFYTAWMIALFLFTIPQTLTTVLYAVGSANPSDLAQKLRFTLGLAFGVGALAAAALLIGAHLIMGLFGEAYVDEASTSLRLLSLAIFPMIIKVHFVAICQIFGRLFDATKIMLVGGSLELLFAALGAHWYGLPGLSLGWVAAIYLEAVVVAPLVYRTATTGADRISLSGMAEPAASTPQDVQVSP